MHFAGILTELHSSSYAPQVLLIVTASVEAALSRNPGYDVRRLLAGTFGSFTGLTSAFSTQPG